MKRHDAIDQLRQVPLFSSCTNAELEMILGATTRLMFNAGDGFHYEKLPEGTLKTLRTPKGAKTLQTVLTYHVVQGEMTPDQIAGKTLTTVEGEKVKVSGSGDNLKAQNANVICGGVKTANATVYLIDSVMIPPSMG